MLGIGAISTAVGWLLIAADSEGDWGDPGITVGIVLGITVGPIMILVGLVTLLVGSVIRANEGP